MSVIGSNALAGASGAGGGAAAGYQIDRSLRFNDDDSAYLSKVFASAGDRKKWTWSGWAKRSTANNTTGLLFYAEPNVSSYTQIGWAGDNFQLNIAYSGSSFAYIRAAAESRDVSAWAHYVVVYDSANATSTDRMILYINGARVTDFAVSSFPNQNALSPLNLNTTHYIGTRKNVNQYFDGYLAEVHFVDGQALAPTDFGEYDDNNVWQPKAFGGTYGPLVDQTQNWSSYGDTNDKSAEAWEDIFDGNGIATPATPHMVAQSGQTAVWTPTTAISFTKLELYANNDGYGDITLNGSISTTGTIPSGGGGSIAWTDVTNLFTTKSLSSIEVPNSYDTDPTRLGAIRIDGKILVDSTVTLTDNSFHLDFSDNTSTTTIAEDSSGNNNDFTANNISVTAGANNDSLIDTPTNYTASSGNNGGNYCTWNPLVKLYSGAFDYKNGNMEIHNVSYAYGVVMGTIPMSSGKWYWEVTINGTPSNLSDYIGIVASDSGISYPTYTVPMPNQLWYRPGGTKVDGSTSSSYGATYGDGDVIGVALDLDSSTTTLTFYKNGVSQGTAFSNLASGKSWVSAVADYSNALTITSWNANWGQRPFAYAPPTDHLSLCTQNLPDPTIADGSTAMDVVTYTGNGGTQSITGFDFSPDYAWYKRRSTNRNHCNEDIVRGPLKFISTSSSGAEVSSTDTTQSFDSNGVTVGGNNVTNASGETYVLWAWDAGDNSSKTYTVKVVSDSGNKYRFDDFGTSAVTLDLEEGSTYVFDQSDSSNSGHPLRFSTTSDGTHGSGSEYTTGVTTTGTPGSAGAKTTIVVAASAPTLYYYCSVHSGMGGQANTNSTAGASNFDGTHQSTVRANAETGFSISTHSRTTAASISTWGHGLGAAPEFAILKPYNGSYNWFVWHKSIGNRKRFYLNSTSAGNSYSFDVWSSDSTTLGIYGTIIAGGGTALDCLTLAWAPIEGYSAFGSYTGNGNADGPFIFTGFRPAFILVKSSSSNISGWAILDSERSAFNEMDDILEANNNNAESADQYSRVDFLSNGFKIRGAGTYGNNVSNTTYIYAAFAEHPFKTARAR